MEDSITIIGSGPAALGAIIYFASRKIPVTVLDVGKTLDNTRQVLLDELGSVDSIFWKKDQIDCLTSNSTISKMLIPKKELAGSNFFYQNLQTKPSFPVAYSHALGGFTSAWGAAILPTTSSDMVRWPFGRERLADAYKAVLQHIPSALISDDLNDDFPAYKYTQAPSIDPADEILINRLSNAFKLSNRCSKKFIVGRSRLALNVDQNSTSRCRVCGYCLSGCAYKSVFNAGDLINKFTRDGLVNYVGGVEVENVFEDDKLRVTINGKKNGAPFISRTKKLYIAAGCIPTTSILVNSKELHDIDVSFIDSQKFLLMMLKSNANKNIWPNLLTFSNIFIEAKDRSISPYWQHTQISPVNDLLLRKLGLINASRLWLASLQPILGRLLIGWAGIHSDLSHGFTVRFKKNVSPSCSDFRVLKNELTSKIIKSYTRNLMYATLKNGLYVFPRPIIGSVSGGNHFGGSFPMGGDDEIFRADELGRPFGWNNIHVIDSTIFPSIPSTTMVLLAIANSYRIAEESYAAV